jgi:hypothetical protein
MKMNKWYKRIQFLLIIFVTINLQARVRTAQTEREFDQQVRKSRIMVALFYDGGNQRPFFHMYESVSSRKLYDDADVVFIKLNMKNKGTNTLVNRYAVMTNPCFIILKDGKPIIDSNGKIAQLVGFVSERELQNFINSYCMQDIKTMVKEKEQNRKQRVEKAQEESDPYFYPAVYYAPEYDFSWQKPLKYDAEGNEIQ